MYQPKTGNRCFCRRGIQRDNCPECEGTGMQINFKLIRQRAPMENGTVILKRTFTMAGIRFWRVLGPQKHPNLNSDLSLEGLKQWGIV